MNLKQDGLYSRKYYYPKMNMFGHTFTKIYSLNYNVEYLLWMILLWWLSIIIDIGQNLNHSPYIPWNKNTFLKNDFSNHRSLNQVCINVLFK